MYAVPIWVCIVENESDYDTSAENDENFGLFQISKRYWCNMNSNDDKICGIYCNNLIDDDIADDVYCAKKIYNRYLYNDKVNPYYAWKTYNETCSKETYIFKYIKDCFD